MSLSLENKQKQLWQILVAAAWIDGEFQPEEKAYLAKIAKQQKALEEAEIQQIISNTSPISSNKCYQLLEEYLGTNPDVEDYNRLLTAISALVYSDGNIATEEAKLLTQLQELEPNRHSTFDKVLLRIQKLYQNSLGE